MFTCCISYRQLRAGTCSTTPSDKRRSQDGARRQSIGIRSDNRARAHPSRTPQAVDGRPHLRPASLRNSIERASSRFRDHMRYHGCDSIYSPSAHPWKLPASVGAAEVDRQRSNLRMSEETAVAAPKNSVFGVPCLPQSGRMPSPRRAHLLRKYEFSYFFCFARALGRCFSFVGRDGMCIRWIFRMRTGKQHSTERRKK